MDDRRAALRQTPGAHALRVEHPDSGTHSAALMDVSRTGLRFRTDGFIPCGQAVTIYAPDCGDLPPCRAQIVRQSLLDGAEFTFDYGARYVDPLDELRHVWFLALRQANG